MLYCTAAIADAIMTFSLCFNGRRRSLLVNRQRHQSSRSFPVRTWRWALISLYTYTSSTGGQPVLHNSPGPNLGFIDQNAIFATELLDGMSTCSVWVKVFCFFCEVVIRTRHFFFFLYMVLII